MKHSARPAIAVCMLADAVILTPETTAEPCVKTTHKPIEWRDGAARRGRSWHRGKATPRCLSGPGTDLAAPRRETERGLETKVRRRRRRGCRGRGGIEEMVGRLGWDAGGWAVCGEVGSRSWRGVKLQSHLEQKLPLLRYRSKQMFASFIMLNRLTFVCLLIRENFRKNYGRKVCVCVAEVGAATKYLKPLRATPIHWPVVAATATISVIFSKSRNRYALLRYSATASTAPHPIKTAKERRQPAGETADPFQVKRFFLGGVNHDHFLAPKSAVHQRKTGQLNFKGSVTAFLES